MFRRHGVAAHRLDRHLIRSRCPAQSQVDAPGVECREGAELFRNHERGVVRKHDSAGPQPDCRGMRRDVCNQDSSGRRGDGFGVVMFRVPDASVAVLFGRPRNLDASVESIGE